MYFQKWYAKYFLLNPVLSMILSYWRVISPICRHYYKEVIQLSILWAWIQQYFNMLYHLLIFSCIWIHGDYLFSSFFSIIHQNMCELVLLLVFDAVEVDDMQHYTFLIKESWRCNFALLDHISYTFPVIGVTIFTLCHF